MSRRDVGRVVVQLPRRLSRGAAMRVGWPKAQRAGKHEFKGFTYDERTGRAVFV